MSQVTILGASGSIGQSALAFLRRHRDKFDLANIAVNTDWQSAFRICREFGCERAAFGDEQAARAFADQWTGPRVEVLIGEVGVRELASHPVDVVLGAVSGCAGLPSITAAIEAGNRIALANKEAIVCCGPELLALAAERQAQIVPVDSEHSAIFQALQTGAAREVDALLLTASGGPFRTASLEEMRRATPAQALAHPNWSMGHKNSIDSATMANKGLELIEAAYLFGVDHLKIEVLINPSSVLHSAVYFVDGSMVAQLGRPDMRVAAGYGLSWPERLETGVERADLSTLNGLRFEGVDTEKFPSLYLARRALELGSDGPLLFNAANEVAVAAFMREEIGLMDISSLIERCLERGVGQFVGGLADAPALNTQAQRFCKAELSTVRAKMR